MKTFNHLWQLLLSTLLFAANRETKEEKFFAVKKTILARYGHKVGYSVQFIDGKQCWTCQGSNIFKGYDRQSKTFYQKTCMDCVEGWYIRPSWNILDRVQLGKHIFLQPIKRVYEDPKLEAEYFNGYTRTINTKLGPVAIFVLCLLYEKGYLKRFWKQSGEGWYVYGWPPRNFVMNTIHILKHHIHSYPVRTFIEHITVTTQLIRFKFKNRFNPEPVVPAQEPDTDLPF